jgi:hypothetical protein
LISEKVLLKLSESANHVNTAFLSKQFEPGAWDVGKESRVDMVRRFRQLQEDFFRNQTEQIAIVETQRRKLEESVLNVTSLYSGMESSVQSGLNTVRLQIQQNAVELDRLSDASEDLQRRQKSTQSALTKFKTASYRMMATKADFDSLSQQTLLTKTGLRELKDITVRSISKDLNELKENDVKFLKYHMFQLQDRMQEYAKETGQTTLTEMEGFKSKLTNLEQVLTSLFKEVQGHTLKEALGT